MKDEESARLAAKPVASAQQYTTEYTPPMVAEQSVSVTPDTARGAAGAGFGWRPLACG
jgi:hypothetical protein